MNMQKILTLGIVNDLAANINLFYLKMLQISIYRIIAVHQKLFTRVEKKNQAETLAWASAFAPPNFALN